MSKPATKARRSGKKLRHQAKLRKRAQRQSLGATMDPIEVPSTPETTQAAGEITDAITEPVTEAEEVLTETETEELLNEENEAIPASVPVVAEPSSEPPMQAAPEGVVEIREPAENNG
jgi:hypothetical protein